jgi:hypothetical protein
MLQIVIFIDNQHDSVEIKEALIDFNPLDVKTAEIITVEVTNKLG